MRSEEAELEARSDEHGHHTVGVDTPIDRDRFACRFRILLNRAWSALYNPGRDACPRYPARARS